MLLTTALGLDFVFRGTSRWAWSRSRSASARRSMPGVWYWVADASQILRVPAWLAVRGGHGDRPGLGRLCAGVRLAEAGLGLGFSGSSPRGRSVGLIHLSQTVIVSADLMVVGLLSRVGGGRALRGAAPDDLGGHGVRDDLPAGRLPHAFEELAGVAGRGPAGSWTSRSGSWCRGSSRWPWGGRCWRGRWSGSAAAGIPRRGPLLALGIWRAPLLSLAFLYQSP